LQLPFQFDFERLVDDFVFLCFFVGNDFLPHLPSLQIREGALDAIMAMYKNSLPTLDGYLTDGGKINMSNCDVLFKDIAKYEEEFFRQEQSKHEREKRFGTGYRGRGGRGGRGDQRGGRGGRGGHNARLGNTEGNG
jgi:5'-3' exoribonuclease 2